jgi:Ca-activated chloride channel family protein
LVLGLVLLIVSIAGPQWGRDWEQSAAPGRDLVVVLDLSRSMLAQDVLPSRAERAKKALEDLSYTVQQRGGHRLALVAFAAHARIVCPLTHDYEHFRSALADLDPAHPPNDLRAAGESAPSGTRIGAGLRTAVETQDPRFRGFQDIMLISDGDDPGHDGEWREGIDAARAFRIPVHVIGIGNPSAGSPIPDKNGEPLRHRGQVILTRLDEKPLQAIARDTGGTYTPARTDTLPLGEIFHARIEPGRVHEESEDILPVYHQHYSWFLSTALMFLGFEMVLGRQRSRKPRRKRETAVNHPPALSVGLSLVVASVVLVSASPQLGWQALVRRGNHAFVDGDLATALSSYAQAEERTLDPGLVAFNEATTLYHLGQYRDAELHFRRSREDAEGPRLARVLYGLGNCLVQQARPGDTRRLRDAIDLYRACLEQDGLDAELIEDARHNLEVARHLWLHAHAEKDRGESRDSENDTGSTPPETNRDTAADNALEASTLDPHGKPRRVVGQVGASKANAAQSDQPAPPGKGNLPPIPDEDELAPLSTEDAVEYLNQAAGRIQHERQSHRQSLVPTVSPSVKDW